MTAMFRAFALSSVLTLSTLPAQACDLALVLAVDVSGSVDPGEYRIQMEGLAHALRDGAVSEALVVAQANLLLMQWTGTSRQHISIPWVEIGDFEDVEAFAAQVEDAPRVWRNFSTAIGEALVVAQDAFDDVPHCTRRVIDVSGDGISNEGIHPMTRHAALGEAGITVNALAIEASDKGLTAWFRENLITGPGAFAMRAADFNDYPDRIRLKLLREVTKQVTQTAASDKTGDL